MASVASVGLLGFLGVVLVPDAAWLWAVLIGFGLGAIFPLCLTLPVDMARSPALVGALAALMLLGGYLISGIGPVLLGSVRDATGNFGASLWLLIGLAGALVGICLALTPDRLRHGVESGPTRPDRVAPDTIAG
jgi:CP family cyanate transporter-like MFS transporter